MVAGPPSGERRDGEDINGDENGSAGVLGHETDSKFATDQHSSPIFVAGYLVLYGLDGDGELNVSRDDVRAALPPPDLLPINVDHRRDCTIGSVLALVDDDSGLFFVGKIDCPRLSSVLSSAASDDIFGGAAKTLSSTEKNLYLVANYLPSASLSSRRLAPGEKADETYFAHVALCLLGKRVGTVVAYDSSVERVLSPFKKLSATAKAAALRLAANATTVLGDTKWDPDPDALGRALLGTAVNNMLLKDRWKVVSDRRKQAGIEGHKYLQASLRTELISGTGGGDICGSGPCSSSDTSITVGEAQYENKRADCDQKEYSSISVPAVDRRSNETNRQDDGENGIESPSVGTPTLRLQTAESADGIKVQRPRLYKSNITSVFRKGRESAFNASLRGRSMNICSADTSRAQYCGSAATGNDCGEANQDDFLLVPRSYYNRLIIDQSRAVKPHSSSSASSTDNYTDRDLPRSTGAMSSARQMSCQDQPMATQPVGSQQTQPAQCWHQGFIGSQNLAPCSVSAFTPCQQQPTSFFPPVQPNPYNQQYYGGLGQQITHLPQLIGQQWSTDPRSMQTAVPVQYPGFINQTSSGGLEQKVSMLLDALTSPKQDRDRLDTRYDPPIHEARYRERVSPSGTYGRKRTRDWDQPQRSNYEPWVYYPGESEPPSGSRYGRDDWSGPDRGPKSVRINDRDEDPIAGLVGAVASLQKEVLNMKNCAQQYYNPSAVPIQHGGVWQPAVSRQDIQQQLYRPGLPQGGTGGNLAAPLEGQYGQIPHQLQPKIPAVQYQQELETIGNVPCTPIPQQPSGDPHALTANSADADAASCPQETSTAAADGDKIDATHRQSQVGPGGRKGYGQGKRQPQTASATNSAVACRRAASARNDQLSQRSLVTVDASAVQKICARSSDPDADAFVEHMMSR